jgi:hypothetical protein
MLTRLMAGEDSFVYVNEDHIVQMAEGGHQWTMLKTTQGDIIQVQMFVDDVMAAFRDEDARRIDSAVARAGD